MQWSVFPKTRVNLCKVNWQISSSHALECTDTNQWTEVSYSATLIAVHSDVNDDEE